MGRVPAGRVPAVIAVGPAGPLCEIVLNAAPFLAQVGGGEVILADPAQEAAAVRSRVAAGGRRCLACDSTAEVAYIARAIVGHFRSAVYVDLCREHAAALTAELDVLVVDDQFLAEQPDGRPDRVLPFLLG